MIKFKCPKQVRSVIQHPFTVPLAGGAALAIFLAYAVYWLLFTGPIRPPLSRKQAVASRPTMPQRDPYASAAEGIDLFAGSPNLWSASVAATRLNRLARGLPINAHRKVKEMKKWRDRLPASLRDRYALRCIELGDKLRLGLLMWSDVEGFILPGLPSNERLKSSRWQIYGGRESFDIEMYEDIYETAYNVAHSPSVRLRAANAYYQARSEYNTNVHQMALTNNNSSFLVFLRGKTTAGLWDWDTERSAELAP